jgi:hypothetical protein
VRRSGNENEEGVIQITDLQFYSAIVGLLLPLGSAVIIQRHWASQIKAIAQAAISLVAAVVITYTEGNLDGDHLRQLFMSFVIVFVPSIAAYYGFFKPTNIAPKIEGSTSPGSPTAGTG